MTADGDVAHPAPAFAPATTSLAALSPVRGPGWVRLTVIWLITLALQAGTYHATTAWGERPLYRITGDEPHYYTIATSLIRDGDLDILNNYRDKHYLPYYPWHLGDPRDPEDMHALYGPTGTLHSKHSLGLPLLIVPAMWFGGFELAIGLLLCISALLAVQLWLLARELTGSGGVATASWLLTATTSPLLFYADQAYPEVPGALLVTIALRALLASATLSDTSRLAGVGAAIALLPWLHLRYIPIAAVIACWGVAWWWRARPGPAPTAVTVGLIGISGLALLGIDWYQFGGIPVVNDYGSIALKNLPAGVLGLLLDRQYGLVPYGPPYLLALYGVVALPATVGWWRAGPAFTILATYFLFIASFSFWFGAFSPPSRMLVPVMPIFVAAVAVALHRWRGLGTTILATVLGAIGWAIVAQLVAVPRLRYNYWDGKSVLLTYLSNAWGTDISEVLPTFVVPDPGAYLWAAGFALAAVAIWWIVVRGPVAHTSRALDLEGEPEPPRPPAYAGHVEGGPIPSQAPLAGVDSALPPAPPVRRRRRA